MKEWKIYALKLKSSDEIKYIGQTSAKINSRLSEHKSHSKKGKYRNAYWIRKHVNDIEIVLIEDSIKSMEESEYIKLFKSLGAKLNNLTDGGGGTEGMKLTDEHRRKLSEAKKGKSPWNKGNKSHKIELVCSFCGNNYTAYDNIKIRSEQVYNFCNKSCACAFTCKNTPRNEKGEYIKKIKI